MANTDAKPINFQFYFRGRPGEPHVATDAMRPRGGVFQYPGVRLRLNTCTGLRGVLDMIFELGNDENVPLPRSVSVGDVICVWLNPYGERKYYAVEPNSFRPVNAAPFEALVRAENLLAASSEWVPAGVGPA